MKIAIPTLNDQVDVHFGRTQLFTIYIMNEQAPYNIEYFSTLSNCGCKSTLFSDLSGIGVKVVLTRHIGQGALNKLRSMNIEVISGFTGTLKQTIDDYANKKLPMQIDPCEGNQRTCK